MHPPDDDAWLLEHSRVLGDRIRAARARQHITQERLYLGAGISRNALQLIEAGQHNPTFHTLLRIARVLDVPLRDLVE